MNALTDVEGNKFGVALLFGDGENAVGHWHTSSFIPFVRYETITESVPTG